MTYIKVGVCIMKKIYPSVLVVTSLLLSSCSISGSDLNSLFNDFNSNTSNSTSVQNNNNNNLSGNKIKDSSGEVDSVNDKVVVSADYSVKIKASELINSNEISVTIPVSKKLFQDKLKTNAAFQPEYYDPKKGEWVSEGKYVMYDEAKESVSFITSVPADAFTQVASTSESSNALIDTFSDIQPDPLNKSILFNNKFRVLADTNQQIEMVYRISVRYFSNMLTAYKEGSNFKIHYYPSNIANKSKVFSKDKWKSSTATDPGIPDFVEDLDTVLNDLYKRLLTISNSTGQVFTPLSVPQDVYIEDLGGDAGSSGLGGPLKISNSKIESLEDMKLTAAHELVHVFQGQYYKLMGIFSGRQNRWSIEAVANYFATVACNLNDEQKKAFYSDFYNDYLSSSLTASNDNSMYAEGHFLDWLTKTYSSTIVGDGLLASSGNDLMGFSSALKSAGKEGISTAFEEFAKYLITTPSGYAGFNKSVKEAMNNNVFGNQFLDGRGFNDKKTYIQLNKTLETMSMVYVSLGNKYTNDSLLVIDSSDSSGALVKSFTYDFVGTSDSNYKGKIPVDSYNQVPSKVTSSIKNYSGKNIKEFEQLILNSSPASKGNISVKYYVLQPPKITYQGSGVLKWSTFELGNIPQDMVTYDVYKGRDLIAQNISPKKAKNNEITFVDLPDPNADLTSFDWNQNFAESKITASDNILVVVKDQKGNSWPIRAKDEVKITILDESGKPNNYMSVNKGQTLKLKALVTGDSNTNVKWEIILDEYYKNSYSKEYFPYIESNKGSISVGSDNQITYHASSSFKDGYGFNMDGISIKIRATSLADPTKYYEASVSINNPDYEGCIVSGSLVTLADGSRKPIEKIQVGDKIVGMDTDAKITIPSVVEKVLVHKSNVYLIDVLKTEDGNELQLTGNHPVLSNAGWKAVDELKVGDIIYEYNYITKLFTQTKVISVIKNQSKTDVVYNLKTTTHNYVANDMLIHNKCLKKGSLIDTPSGLKAIDMLQVGDMVWGRFDGKKVATEITNVFTKDTILDFIAGKKLTDKVSVTVNHVIEFEGNFVKAGKTNLPDEKIFGTVYDLKTTTGNYYGDSILMESAKN